MRRLAAALAVIVCALPRLAAAQQPAAPEVEFWETVVTPHAARIAKLRAEGTQLKNRANQYYEVHMTADRMRFLNEALDKYRAAADLAPDRADVVLDFAAAAFDAQAYDEAATAYLRYQQLNPDDHSSMIDHNLAWSYVKLLRFDDAAATLEHSLGDETAASYDRSQALSLLGYIYMAQGRLEDSIDAYTRASLGARQQYYGGADTVSLCGLAVAYDRDEQVGRAQELLEQVRQLDPSFAILYPQQYVTAQAIPFSPPSDRHYWMALGYEANKAWSDAAVEWRAYIESADPLYKRRAEEHLKGVTDELDKKLKATAKAAHDDKAKGKGSKGKPK